ncbi:hypothetical protein LMJ38_10840 [Streptomyces sp. R1]|uniref:hypothetical protein n=1 Tax=Streptomyces sp. R1 TaxID=1509279 RepID=UPI001E5E3132|nr:hypothetical protein [Streptomyces sp. R1]MCC8336433.1 hypothetical protein [Streptomyces sp. R1]
MTLWRTILDHSAVPTGTSPGGSLRNGAVADDDPPHVTRERADVKRRVMLCRGDPATPHAENADVCLRQPPDFRAAGLRYDDFDQVGDDRVAEILNGHRTSRSRP